MFSKILKVVVALMIIISSTLVPLKPDNETKASVTPPGLYRNGASVVEVQGSTISGIYRRVDETATVNPVLGLYRYPTLYEGGFGSSLMDTSKISQTLNTNDIMSTHSFPNEAMGLHPNLPSVDYRRKIAKAVGSQKYFHLVPDVDNPTSARNIIDPSLVDDIIFNQIYGGAIKHLPTIPLVDVFTISEGASDPNGSFYYIQDLAREAGFTFHIVNEKHFTPSTAPTDPVFTFHIVNEKPR